MKLGPPTPEDEYRVLERAYRRALERKRSEIRAAMVAHGIENPDDLLVDDAALDSAARLQADFSTLERKRPRQAEERGGAEASSPLGGGSGCESEANFLTD